MNKDKNPVFIYEKQGKKYILKEVTFDSSVTQSKNECYFEIIEHITVGVGGRILSFAQKKNHWFIQMVPQNARESIVEIGLALVFVPEYGSAKKILILMLSSCLDNDTTLFYLDSKTGNITREDGIKVGGTFFTDNWTLVSFW